MWINGFTWKVLFVVLNILHIQIKIIFTTPTIKNMEMSQKLKIENIIITINIYFYYVIILNDTNL